MSDALFRRSPDDVVSALDALAGATGDIAYHDVESTPPLPRRGWARRAPELNVVPLIDVLFLLLVFFVIAGTFAVGEGILESRMLPGSGRGAGVPLPFDPIVVEFKSGSGSARFWIRLMGKPELLKSHAELTRELSRLRSLSGFGAETPVVIVSDDNVVWDDVAGGWNAALRAGFRQIAFGYPPPADR